MHLPFGECSLKHPHILEKSCPPQSYGTNTSPILIVPSFNVPKAYRALSKHAAKTITWTL